MIDFQKCTTRQPKKPISLEYEQICCVANAIKRYIDSMETNKIFLRDFEQKSHEN